MKFEIWKTPTHVATIINNKYRTEQIRMMGEDLARVGMFSPYSPRHENSHISTFMFYARINFIISLSFSRSCIKSCLLDVVYCYCKSISNILQRLNPDLTEIKKIWQKKTKKNNICDLL